MSTPPASDPPLMIPLWPQSLTLAAVRARVYLEDLYVKPEARGHGVGTVRETVLSLCDDRQLGSGKRAVCVSRR